MTYRWPKTWAANQPGTDKGNQAEGWQEPATDKGSQAEGWQEPAPDKGSQSGVSQVAQWQMKGVTEAWGRLLTHIHQTSSLPRIKICPNLTSHWWTKLCYAHHY